MKSLFFFFLLLSIASASSLVAIKVVPIDGEDPIVTAKRIADDNPEHIEYVEPAGGLQRYFIYKLKSTSATRYVHENSGHLIEESSVQTPLVRNKRNFFNDPYSKLQWHHNLMQMEDIWSQGIDGKGVGVAVVDDGLDIHHDEFVQRYNAQGSHDFNLHQPEPIPMLADDMHGTRCAGEIAAQADNNKCGVGIAYNSHIAGIRILSGPVSDVLEASALTYASDVNHIYSNSWGPPDDGETVEAPGPLTQLALKEGTTNGRDGLGSIFVFASGNGGMNGDNCAYDGYVSSIYTIGIGAIDRDLNAPNYQEWCTAQMAVAFSSNKRDYIYTSDIRNGCTDKHGGTSAAAPIAAGVIALVLQVRPDLSWRDIQWLIATTSQPFQSDHIKWQMNGNGLLFHPLHGFGLIDAKAMVEVARYWIPVAEQERYEFDCIYPGPQSVCKYDVNIPLSKDFVVEHTIAQVDIRPTRYRGDIELELISAHETVSQILTRRYWDRSTEWLVQWPAMTVFNWGENDPNGAWTVTVKGGTLDSCKLIIYGHHRR